MVSAVDVHVRRLRKVESRAVHQLMSLTIPTDSSLSIDLSRRRRQSMRRPTEAPSANSRISASCLRARLMLHSFVRSFVHSFIHSSATSESSLLRQLRVSVTRNSMFFFLFFAENTRLVGVFYHGSAYLHDAVSRLHPHAFIVTH